MPRESAGVSADVYRRSRMQRERIIKELRERGTGSPGSARC